jgi:uncharacterized protein
MDARVARHVTIGGADMVACEALLRRLDLALRTPDALNIAIVQRIGATLATFDRRMAVSAEALGIALAST